MNLKNTFILILLLTACGTTRRGTETPAPPLIIEDPVATLSRGMADAVLWQYASAEAHRLFQQGFELARIRLEQNLQKSIEGIPAVIVDIDETVLDNSPYEVHLVNNQQVYEPATWKAWTDMASAPALPGAVDFLIHATEQGCEIYYISNRHVSELETTMANLQDAGFPFADEEHMLFMEEVSDKTARRAQVAAKHPVVLLVGDQLRDFDERFKDRSEEYGKGLVDEWADTLSQYFIMLPNPMYGTFRDAIQGKGKPEEQLRHLDDFFRENAY
jgi:5'-nucleotidase (lipoprotein e(P4) family)